ncbi:hypothetical protein BB8028_0005g01550 [Beauveria bassiana]|uniref:Uncharacterized protein n=1 Tax=Beauveria bassiana TaxID=176275 RepID=A0A2S7YF54_BEABA|nr:hypothetical protein BB8028_0005g01550 [Beauveria bassiana]
MLRRIERAPCLTKLVLFATNCRVRLLLISSLGTHHNYAVNLSINARTRPDLIQGSIFHRISPSLTTRISTYKQTQYLTSQPCSSLLSLVSLQQLLRLLQLATPRRSMDPRKGKGWSLSMSTI